MALTTVLNVKNYSMIALNHMVGSRNVDFGLRTTELKLNIDQDIHGNKKAYEIP